MRFRVARFAGLVARWAGRLRVLSLLGGVESTRLAYRIDKSLGRLAVIR